MDDTRLLRRHEARDTTPMDARRSERLIRQSALLAIEMHAPGEVSLRIDRSVAMDALLALTEWVRLAETRIGQQRDAATLDLNLHAVRIRLLVRDLASAIEASGRDTLPEIEDLV